MTSRAQTGGTPRERFREQLRSDVKDTALRQLAEGGPAAVSVNAIAKELGLSGPALYRYFASRDALLDALVIDAYRDLADALEAARRSSGRDPLEACAAAYRAWGRAHPHRYRLLFGQPASEHDGHREELVAATARLMELMLDAVRAEPGPIGAAPRGLSEQLRAWATDRQLEASAPEALRAITIWARLHGWTRLEIDGNFASMGLDSALLPLDLGA